MSQIIKIAAIQTNPKLLEPEKNLEGIIDAIKEAAGKQADLIVFPECALTGYMFRSRDEALPFAETIPGPATEKLIPLCKELGVYVIFGLLEKEKTRLYNAAAFIGPEGIVGKYRKNHLPFLGIDRFVDRGDKTFKVYRTPIGNIGMEICYDIMFAEASRIMMLLGADILALSTNFPRDRAGDVIKYVIPTRAIENGIYVVAADRVGRERGATFAGRSKIVATSGKAIIQASANKAEIIYGEVDLELARRKHLVTVPGEYETHRIKDRRPELYGKITEPVEVDNTQHS
jgi:predicted amidohydrolase